MSLREKLDADVKDAMRSKNEVVRDTLRLVLAEFKRLELQEGKTITPEIETDVLLKFVKQRQQSIDDYEGAGRSDLAVKERAEQAVLQAYLPKAMDEAAARVADCREWGDLQKGHGARHERRHGQIPRPVGRQVGSEAARRAVALSCRRCTPVQ